jgi:hypothetical protein
MSVLYASASDLASYLQQDIDTSTATLALQVASQLFSTRADTMFLPTTTTYRTIGLGYRQLQLPFRPVISIQQVRIISQFSGTLIVTDYVQIKTVLYRLIGFGLPGVFPPDALEVDLTHGYATVPDDVKGAVLETAAGAYKNPDPSTSSESIDDYSVHSAPNAGGVMLTPAAALLADLYKGTVMA